MVENEEKKYYEEEEEDTFKIKKPKKRRSAPFNQLDITSLVDILTIVLVFLIKNVSVEAQKVNPPQNMELPQSVFEEDIADNVDTILMRIYPNQIFVGDVPAGSPDDFLSDQSVRDNLRNFLSRQSEAITQRNPELNPIVLIQGDANVRSKYISDIVAVIAATGFRGIYFSTNKAGQPPPGEMPPMYMSEE